jgi:heme exporter protein D
VYVLDVGKRAGVLRIDRGQQVHRFASIAGVDSLNGIAFDTEGRFGWRLLVTGPHGKSTVVVALDCRGNQARITERAPVLEGGLAVAPAGFGAFAGDLVAPDELSGRLVAIGPDGKSSLVAASGLPAGQDTGVEGVGFVPTGFASGGRAYFADRATSGSANPGSDSLISLNASGLVAAGMREGDLLAATEGGARLVDVRCARTCQVRALLDTGSPAHGEGHLLLVATHSWAAPRAMPGAMMGPTPFSWLPLVITVVAVVLLIVVGPRLWLRYLRRRQQRGNS